MSSLDESIRIRKRVPHEGLALLSALVERDMDHNFQLMQSLYESEKERCRELEWEVRALRPDAKRWRLFAAMMRDTIDPPLENA